MAKDSFYETFDSGSGPVIPEKSSGDFAHQDSKTGLNDYTKNSVDNEQGAVPEVPKKSR